MANANAPAATYSLPANPSARALAVISRVGRYAGSAEGRRAFCAFISAIHRAIHPERHASWNVCEGRLGKPDLNPQGFPSCILFLSRACLILSSRSSISAGFMI